MKKILTRLLFCPEESLNNVLMHIPVGIVIVFLAMLSGWVALVFGIGFFIYELNEQHDLGDKAYQDIKGCLFGIGMTGIPWALVTII